MTLTPHEEKLANLKAAFCDCGEYSINPKDHKSWCPYIVFKVLKPQPKSEQKKRR